MVHPFPESLTISILKKLHRVFDCKIHSIIAQFNAQKKVHSIPFFTSSSLVKYLFLHHDDFLTDSIPFTFWNIQSIFHITATEILLKNKTKKQIGCYNSLPMVFYCVCRKFKVPFLMYKALYYLVFTHLFSFAFYQVLLVCMSILFLFLKYFKFIIPWGYITH